MPAELIPRIEADRIGAQKPFHPSDQVPQRRFHRQMEMIAHQIPRMHFPPALHASFPQRRNEQFPIRISTHNVFLSVSTIPHMVNGSFR